MAVSRTCSGSNSRGRGMPATIHERSFKNKLGYVDFDIPADLSAYLAELDEFIEREIRPLEQQDDNIRFFDYRREDARTDWDRGGLPSPEGEELLREAVRRAGRAGPRPAAPGHAGR